MKPIVHDLFSGLEGWGKGFVSEGYRVIGYDIVDMYKELGYQRPAWAELILCDVRSIHGSQCKDAAVIVASPPCQEPAFRAQPWKSARALRPDMLPIWWNKVERSPANLKKSNIEVMTESEMKEWEEYQAFYPLPPPTLFIKLFNSCFRIQREASEAAGHYIPLIVENVRGAEKWVGSARWHFGSYYLWGDVPALMPPTFRIVMKAGVTHRSDGSTNWHREGVKSPGTKLSEVGFNVRNAQRFREEHQKGIPHAPTGHWTNPRENGTKQPGKAASAEIAKIPFPLAQWIAKCFKPQMADVAFR